MIHIISNPHNGSKIDFLGVVLEPGFEQPVKEQTAEELSQRFPFLLMRVVEGEFDPKKSKAVKISGKLEWETVVDPEPDIADGVKHVAGAKAPAARKPAAKKVASKKVAKGKK